MSTIEARYRQTNVDSRVIFVLGTGVYRPRIVEQPLLPPPKVPEKEESNKFGFDAQKEANYIARIEPRRQRTVLKADIATTVEEAIKFTFVNTYNFVNHKVVDEKSGEEVLEVVKRGKRNEETAAFEVIERGLMEEGVMMVHVSPDNAKLHYPKGVVDIWTREGKTVRWARVTTENSFEELREIYKNMGGSEVKDRSELLSKPIPLKDKKIIEVINKFKLTKEKNKISSDEINRVVDILIDNFTRAFGKEFMVNSGKIFRLYSAAMTEVPKWIKEKAEMLMKNIAVGWERMNAYLFAPMMSQVMGTYGCDSMTMVGRFMNNAVGLWQRFTGGLNNLFNRIRSFFGEKHFDCPRCGGKIESGKGIEVCPHCGAKKSDYGTKCD